MVRGRLSKRVGHGRSILGRREWSISIEEASLRRDEAKHVAALRAFGSLDGATRMRLAMELVETREPELALAYDNVVMVMAGLKRVSPRRRSREWHRSPCIIFIVRRKWSRGRTRSKDPQRLPGCLLTYADVGGRRTLCAVPTDVLEEVEFFGAKAHQPSGIRARAGSRGEVGNVACAVHLADGSAQHLLMMSCHHVLSPMRTVGDPEPDGGSAVMTFNTQVPIGTGLPLGGSLHADGKVSLDVQMGSVDNPAALASAVRGLRLSPARKLIATLEEFRALPPNTQYLILASPHNNTGAVHGLPAEFSGYVENKALLNYKFRDGANQVTRLVRHGLLLAFRVLAGKATLPGDSGATIVCAGPGGGMTLVAMHIGGGAAGGIPYSFGIPAWWLFNPFNYGLSPSATLEPVNVM